MYERWMENASCADFPREMFFPTDGGGVVRAQKVCASCPVSGDCLRYALANHIDHGVWGGCSERKRRRLLHGIGLADVGLADAGLKLIPNRVPAVIGHDPVDAAGDSNYDYDSEVEFAPDPAAHRNLSDSDVLIG